MTEQTGTDQRIGRVDVVYHATWEIDAPLAEVFPAVFDFRTWQGYDSIENVSGTVGAEGELMRIKKPEAEMGWQEKFCKTIRLDPQRQIIWRVYTGPGQVGADGWEYEWGATIDYRFEADGPTRTVVRLQVIKEFFVPYEDESELARVQKSEYELQAAIAENFRPRLYEILGR